MRALLLSVPRACARNGSSMFRPSKIISGGQTGADRAGLDAAKQLGIVTGGQAPFGYMTENGPDLSLQDFGLSNAGNYFQRTRTNVLRSDATIVFMRALSRGSKVTLDYCARLKKPFYAVNPSVELAKGAWELREWLAMYQPAVLNVAGNRESVAPGIHDEVVRVLVMALSPEDVSCA